MCSVIYNQFLKVVNSYIVNICESVCVCVYGIFDHGMSAMACARVMLISA